MKKLQFCLVFLFLLLLALSAAAQVQNGTFTGTVTDPSGATIPNAKVTVTNLATNLSVTTTTNSDGVYSARDLPVGTYKITAEAKGFKTISNSGTSLNAGTIARIDLKLQLGEAREVVEVTGEAPAPFDDNQLCADREPAVKRPQRIRPHASGAWRCGR